MKAEKLQRINIIGTSGSGKSTFSKKLSSKLNSSHIEMDSLFWKSNWSESTDHEFHQKLEIALAPNSWVLDGNYHRTEKLKWKYVQTIIWLDYSYRRILFHAFKRSVQRAFTKEEIWPNTNNRETFYRNFLSKDSALLWTIMSYRKNKKKYETLMSNPEYSHIHFVRIRSPKEAIKFLNSISN